ncbi:cytoplasmic dynein 2 intermediate chain 1 isoform X2 [Oncorhynchus tshawytscha]|uniref:WD repeat-containing protein 60 n=1 Tax=Oncorhynchus tshawytscha TaxID=74940 RepID=A0A8C8FNF8_ONCTS|nr:cytoplasmic dynein 2 intermediate chain 1 isoform X2 [Oncorhynchus tshawytscha]
MPTDKKITKEDTWKSDDLRRHIRGGGHDEDSSSSRRRDDERRHRTGESVERRHRDPEREARREREKNRERDGTGERTKPRDADKDRHQDRRKDGSRDRMGEKEERDKERSRAQDRVIKGTENVKYRNGDRDSRDKMHDREEKENRDRERVKARERDTERTRERERDALRKSDRDKEKEKNKESETGERDRERKSDRDRKRNEERAEGGRDRDREHDREKRDRRKEREYLKESEGYKDRSQKDKERKERHMDKEHSGQKEEREYREQHRKEKEEKERRHKERAQHNTGESRRHDGESREVESERVHRERKGSDREREGKRDKHRERRHREEAIPERDPTERNSAKKSSSSSDLRVHKDKTEPVKTKEVVMRSESAWRSSQKQLSDTEEPVEIAEAPAEDRGYDEAQDYEEDFEDYEEDFEDVDDSEGEDEKQTRSHEEREAREEISSQRREEIEAIQRAMDEENERVGSAQPRLSTEEDDRPKRSRDSETPQSKVSQHGRFMDFVAAKHREVSKKVASKQKKRSTELLRLIDLDYSITFSLLDLPPVNEYDMYIKNFGTTNTKQAYVQCNEDNTDRDIQTEEIEMSEKWTQHPAERNVGCGGPKLSHEASDESVTKLSIDSQRLATFLRSASQVVAVLLEEDRAEKQSLKKLRTQADTLSFSDGCLQLNTKLPFLYGRQISLVQFSQVQRQTMLSVHNPSAKPSAVRLDSKTIICIWNIWEPSRPQKILVYESEVQCCCFSPGKATLVFAGTSVGSVVLWDLREHASAHYTLRIGENDWTLRHPTFSTDAVLAASGHMSSVSSVEAVLATVAEGLRPELPLLASDEESSGLSFQLASLDGNGVLNLWVVLELPKANDAGSHTDLGLRPGGKVKLLHSSTVITTSERSSARDAKKTTLLQTLLLKFLPSDSNHFFIGTNMGLVNHGTSHGLKAPPKFYRPQVVGFRPVDVTSIDFSPFGEPIFLVGCGDGSVRLHTVLSEQPLMEWTSSTAGQPVLSVQWAQTRPTVFCVLDAASYLHIWDLLEKDFEPVITEKIDADRVTAMAVFGDPAKQNTYSGISLATQSGKIEMQYFSKRLTVPESADLEKLQIMMQEAF